MKLATESLCAAGFVVVRFNWSYFTQGGKPSIAFKQEVEDSKYVKQYLRKQANSHYPFLGGKFMGGRVCLQDMSVAPDTDTPPRINPPAGLVLLTPPLHDPVHGTVIETNPRMTAEEMGSIQWATFVASGNREPLCDGNKLQAAAQLCPIEAEVMIAPGAPCFAELGPVINKPIDLQRVAGGLAQWTKRLISCSLLTE